MADNGNYVCTICRMSKRDSQSYEVQYFPVCSRCHNKMEYIGKHWRVPKKNDDKEWKLIIKLLKHKKSQNREICGL